MIAGNALAARQLSVKLVCTDCRAQLASRQESLECPTCGTTVPLHGGIPYFISDFPYWGEMPLEQMLEVNRRAASNWRSAVCDYDHPAVRRTSEMIVNLERANWHRLVSLPREASVLDIGAGMGTNSHSLSRFYRQVVAVEPVGERIDFMRHRFSQEGLSNVEIIRSSVWKLPFAEESFDLVCMNGVLEWVAQGRREDPAELQRKALKNIFRLLRPGGYLYLGIENRTTLGNFVGYPDPHCGIPFVAVLPRPLAHWYAKRHGQEHGYRNYLYSHRGYRKLLESAGFGDTTFYIASPSYNHPRYLVPLEGPAADYYFKNFGGRGTGLLARLGRWVPMISHIKRYAEYSYAILAKK